MEVEPRTGADPAGAAKVTYLLYLLGSLIYISAIVGVVIAYVYRAGAPEWLLTHFRFQVRTFWIGLLYLLIGGLLSPVLVGYLLVLFWFVWVIVRCIRGYQWLGERRPVPRPASWMFG